MHVLRGLTYHNVIRCRCSTDRSLWHSSIAAARHSRELGLRHHLQAMATLPSPWLEVYVVWKWNKSKKMITIIYGGIIITLSIKPPT